LRRERGGEGAGRAARAEAQRHGGSAANDEMACSTVELQGRPTGGSAHNNSKLSSSF
jgi:hypothetical protein